MKATPQTIQQIGCALDKITLRFPQGNDNCILTDIHIQVKSETGELIAYDDNGMELVSVAVDQWAENADENFYEDVASAIRVAIRTVKSSLEHMSILKPFSFVLVDNDMETLCDLYIVDDELAILDTELMKDLDEDLENFMKKLFEN